MVVVLPPSGFVSEIDTYVKLLAAAEAIAGRSIIAGAMTALTADLNRKLRIRAMITTSTLGSNSLPSDFLEAESFTLSNCVLTPSMDHTVTPYTFTVGNGALILKDGASAANGVLRYYAKLPVLEAAGTNPVYKDNNDLYLWGLLAHHALLVRDRSGMDSWVPTYQRALDDLQEADAMSRVGTVPMEVTTNALADH